MKTKIRVTLRSLWLVIMGLSGATLLIGCIPGVVPTTPANTEVVTGDVPQPAACDPIFFSNDAGLSRVQMPDGSEIYLGEYTEIRLLPAGYCPDLTGHQVQLLNGRVAIRVFPEGSPIQVSAPNGGMTTLDTTGLVIYDTEIGQFVVSCTNGICTVGSGEQQLGQLFCGESAVLEQDGTYKGPFTVDLALLTSFGNWLYPTCVLPEASTPDRAATTTAECATFESQFPLTPCAPTNP